MRKEAVCESARISIRENPCQSADKTSADEMPIALNLCATVVRILARRPDRSPDPSLLESHLSPHVSQSGVASHSPRQDALPHARKPRRQAIPSLLPCDCRLRRATGGLRGRRCAPSMSACGLDPGRFARHLRLQTRPLEGERAGEAASKARAASEGQSREERRTCNRQKSDK